MLLLFGAFIAGMLTVLAPCVLPLLPIIIGGSVTGDSKDKKRPLIIAASLAVSLIVFTLLLKATTLLINIPPNAITYLSGSIIIALGLLTLFPTFYAKAIAKLGIEHRAQVALGKGYSNKKSYVGPIVIGAALGPVFSSCSPVYAYILATVLPVNFAQAFLYILAFVLGLSSILLLIGYYGQRFVSKIKFASNPKGIFQRIIAVLFIVVGLLVFTGYDKRIQTWVSQHTPFDFDALSAQLIPGEKAKKNTNKNEDPALYNIEKYTAPELVGLQDWLNSNPQSLASLKGKVVLVDFWTYSCINCIRALPYVQGWYETYKDSGFVVLGIHAPEFAFEKVPANVKKAVDERGLTYPIALDNDFSTWNAFNNQYWPAQYLIDKDGMVRRTHFGEGEYAKTEETIRALLQETGIDVNDKTFTDGKEKVPVATNQTPETYLGKQRASNYVGMPALGAAVESSFVPAEQLKTNQWTLSGTWAVQGEKIIAKSMARLRIKTAAKEVYIVAGSAAPKNVQVLINGKPIEQTNQAGQDAKSGFVTVLESRLYRLVMNEVFTEGDVLELLVPDGVELNVFTFGS